MFLIYSENCETDKLDQSLEKIVAWSDLWQIRISLEKCMALYLGKKNPHRKYFINNHVIPPANTVRDLGVLIDKNLSFDNHISHAVRSAYFKAHQLLRTLKSSDPRIWSLAHKAYVRPHLEYASEVWNPTLKQHLKSGTLL